MNRDIFSFHRFHCENKMSPASLFTLVIVLWRLQVCGMLDQDLAPKLCLTSQNRARLLKIRFPSVKHYPAQWSSNIQVWTERSKTLRLEAGKSSRNTAVNTIKVFPCCRLGHLVPEPVFLSVLASVHTNSILRITENWHFGKFLPGWWSSETLFSVFMSGQAEYEIVGNDDAASLANVLWCWNIWACTLMEWMLYRQCCVRKDTNGHWLSTSMKQLNKNSCFHCFADKLTRKPLWRADMFPRLVFL